MNYRIEKFSIMLLIIALCFPGISIACSCAYMGKFIEYTSGGNGVIHARIISYGSRLPHGNTLYESMVVEVIEVIKGKYTGQEIIFLGDPGHLCRAYVDSEKFAVGSEHFISIGSEELIQPLGGCGESSVIIKGDLIEGIEITDSGYVPYTLKIRELVELLNES
jgi:hypothetical protein